MEDGGLVETLYRWRDALICGSSAGKSGCVSATLGALSLSSLLISCCLLFCYRCKVNACNAGGAVAWGIYCLIGDFCNTAGSVLAHQLPLQIIMAFFMLTLDVLLLTAVILPFCWFHHSRAGRRARVMSRRRRQNSLAVFLLFGMGGSVYFGIPVKPHSPSVTGSSVSGRKLLGVFLQDETELLGYVLGLLWFAISWTSRFLFFLKAGRAETGSPLWLSSRGLKALSGGLYASAILVHDTRLESIVRALPWILSGSCCAILDVIILFVSCYRVYSNGQSVQPLSTDTASLLGRRLFSGQLSPKKDKPARKLHHPSRRSSTATEAEIGCYMDVHLQPVRKVCLKEVTITREGSVDSQPLRRCVKVVRVDECYSSGSTTDSSSVSSELEWDFEQTSPQWSSQSGGQHSMEASLLQEKTLDQRSKCSSGSNSPACFCRSSDPEEQPVSALPDANLTRLND
ncbi:transmembrane protein 44 [Astyanax mexicanus]|uniref:transmembrane protein 44 n=1 Tax=Astyanax mexicanus TaxID=7994 RepID=UPI0020CB4CC4|nr:transmembrane protein 44 [Astyanax mexicanus]